MKTINVLGMDYGASNGRGIIGKFDGDRVILEEVHRFPNNSVSYLSGMYWDVLALFNELKRTLAIAKAHSVPISSIGIDTWALDFGVLDGQGNLMGNPHTYRDGRVNTVAEEVLRTFPGYEIFSRTGVLPAPIFTLFQIVSMKYREKTVLEKGKTILFIPNLLSYFLTGNISCDSTQASPSLLYSPFTQSWIEEFFEGYNIPNLFPEIDKTGSIIGNVTDEIMSETGIGKTPVISVASHDTASAVAAVPAEDKKDVIYISCGTWSVVGTTLEKPLVSREAFDNNFNNEMGYDNEVMFVKNITGLWVLQECVREWEMEGYKIDYGHMAEYAWKSKFSSYIDTDSQEFAQPGNMCGKVLEYCRKTGQTQSGNREEIYKCIIDGLALKYKETVDQLKKLAGRKFSRLHMIGGGSRDKYLCGVTAKLTGVEVAAGPYEATVIGNIMAQLIALGEVSDMKQAVQIIKKSFPLEVYGK